jgi:hypothetical protein
MKGYKSIRVIGDNFSGFQVVIDGLELSDLKYFEKVCEDLEVKDYEKLSDQVADQDLRTRLLEIWRNISSDNPQKLFAVKEIKDITGLGLKEAKDMLDTMFLTVKKHNDFASFWISNMPNMIPEIAERLSLAFNEKEVYSMRGRITASRTGIL